MAIRKIIYFISILFYFSNAHSEFILPDKKLGPNDVLKIQLEALKNNDIPSTDFGIEQTWLFAHPNNKVATGPLARFKIMLYSESYRILIDHHSHEIQLISNNLNKYVYGVKILTSNKQIFFYEWHLEKGDEKDCKSCWYTSVVSNPIDQGNTI